MDDLLCKYKQHQTDLLLNLKTVESNVHAFYNYINTTIQECKQQYADALDEQHKQIRELDLQLAEATLKIQQMSVVERDLVESRAHEQELVAKIMQLEEENKSFRKVSRIIAFENENAALKGEIESLKRRLSPTPVTTIDKQIADIDIDTLSQIMTNSEVGDGEGEVDNDGDEQGDDELELDLYEKKIKGTVYYISNDSLHRVYLKNKDGSVGNDIGRLDGKHIVLE